MRRAPGLLLLAALLWIPACGDDEGQAPGAADPAREAYEQAPVPPPIPYAGSSVRVDAGRRGVFAGLPGVSPQALGDLLRLFPKAREDARSHPGRQTGGAAGETWEPSFDELRAAEIGQRIEDVLAQGRNEQTREAWRSAGLASDQPLEYGSFQVVSVKVYGTGYVQTVQPVTRAIPAP
jgi:hypothetical protein